MTSSIALIVEEVTSIDQPTQVTQRMIQFRDCGIPLIWLVDYEERAVIVYRKGTSFRYFNEREEVSGDCAFPNIPVRVSEFLPPPGEHR